MRHRWNFQDSPLQTLIKTWGPKFSLLLLTTRSIANYVCVLTNITGTSSNWDTLGYIFVCTLSQTLLTTSKNVLRYDRN